MTRRAGFTLVELLVVIAIIAILAGIAVPKVSQHLRKSKVTRALVEVKQIDSSFQIMLTDTGKTNICDLFVETGSQGLKGRWSYLQTQMATTPLQLPDAMRDIQQIYQEVCYKLLRKGKDFEEDASTSANGFVQQLRLRPDVKKKLAASYMDIGLDPWGNQYQMVPGGSPRWPALAQNVGPWPMYLRSYRGPKYVYNFDAKVAADAVVPGNPVADTFLGFPAPSNLAIAVYSLGEDGVDNQGGYPFEPTTAPENGREKGGGDDINNWDNTNGWDEAYGG